MQEADRSGDNVATLLIRSFKPGAAIAIDPARPRNYGPPAF
jgi:hypothetical protein